MSFERIVQISPAYDRRDTSQGVHCCELRMILKGPLGAVQFVCFTGWFPKSYTNDPPILAYPVGCDLGYHSPHPMYDEQSLMNKKCEYLDGKSCYYDGSTLNSEPVMKMLVEEGSEAVWRYLEGYYTRRFVDV